MKTEVKSFISASHASELSSPRQRTLFYIWNIAIFLLSAAGICIISLVLSVGKWGMYMFAGYFIKPLVFLLNFIPIAIFQLIFLALFNRQ